ncbi:hypothetical protein F5Y19DRAFT_486595 [Xylariaceae sp. FL1651]|nr:hypothetical protein F5Y19DRAFT_486595 [Xylariaceae sp. FL1651]
MSAPSIRSSLGFNRYSTEETPKSLECPKCHVVYPTTDELLKHQGSAKHFACDQCELSFWTQEGLEAHKQKNHRSNQDITCPGCEGHFTRAGLFYKHIEENKCKAIFASDVARRRETLLAWATELGQRGGRQDDIPMPEESHIKKEDTWATDIKSEATVPSEPVTTSEISRRPGIFQANAHRVYYRAEDFPDIPSNEYRPYPEDFPALGGHHSHQGTSSHAGSASAITSSRGLEHQEGNVWREGKVLFPKTSNHARTTYNAVAPPVSYDTPPAAVPHRAIQHPTSNNKIRTIHAPIGDVEASAPQAPTQQIIDPDHPDFNPAVFHNEILDKWVCPHMSCGTKLKSAPGLTAHLRSPAHTGGRIPCRGCRKVFTTTAALIQHMETTSTCNIRQSDDFRAMLGQATGGLLDVDTHSILGNGTTRFVLDERVIQEVRNPGFGLMTGREQKESEVINDRARQQDSDWKSSNVHW